MDGEPVFTGNDLRLIESLEYNPSLEPSFDALRACLVWRDEEPSGLTPAGHEALRDLWIARSFLHRGLDFSVHPLDPEYFRNIWNRALRQGFKWPGFNRLSLNARDKAYYEEMLNQENPF
ncbi:MAG TPA: hypothetical protein V6D08_15060 [Candidatus Obscuribacterales bacterium]